MELEQARIVFQLGLERHKVGVSDADQCEAEQMRVIFDLLLVRITHCKSGECEDELYLSSVSRL